MFVALIAGSLVGARDHRRQGRRGGPQDGDPVRPVPRPRRPRRASSRATRSSTGTSTPSRSSTPWVLHGGALPGDLGVRDAPRVRPGFPGLPPAPDPRCDEGRQPPSPRPARRGEAGRARRPAHETGSSAPTSSSARSPSWPSPPRADRQHRQAARGRPRRRPSHAGAPGQGRRAQAVRRLRGAARRASRPSATSPPRASTGSRRCATSPAPSRPTSRSRASTATSRTGAGGQRRLRGAIQRPAITLSGCARRPAAVARLMARLRNVDGVTRVSLSQLREGRATASQRRRRARREPLRGGRPPTFELVVFFERSPRCRLAPAPRPPTPPGAQAAPAAGAAPRRPTAAGAGRRQRRPHAGLRGPPPPTTTRPRKGAPRDPHRKILIPAVVAAVAGGAFWILLSRPSARRPSRLDARSAAGRQLDQAEALLADLPQGARTTGELRDGRPARQGRPGRRRRPLAARAARRRRRSAAASTSTRSTSAAAAAVRRGRPATAPSPPPGAVTSARRLLRDAVHVRLQRAASSAVDFFTRLERFVTRQERQDRRQRAPAAARRASRSRPTRTASGKIGAQIGATSYVYLVPASRGRRRPVPAPRATAPRRRHRDGTLDHHHRDRSLESDEPRSPTPGASSSGAASGRWRSSWSPRWPPCRSRWPRSPSRAHPPAAHPPTTRGRRWRRADRRARRPRTGAPSGARARRAQGPVRPPRCRRP